MIKRIVLFSIVSLLIFSGCASTKLVSSWSKPGFSGPPLKKLLVLAVSNNDMQRRLYEDSFAANLRSEGVDVITSYSLIETLGKSKEENTKFIKAAVTKTAADSVLIVTLAGIENEEQYVPASTVHVAGRGGAYGMFGYYGHSHRIIHQSAYTLTNTTVKLHTAVFEAQTEEMLWAGDTQRLNPDSASVAIQENIKLISTEMKKAGLL